MVDYYQHYPKYVQDTTIFSKLYQHVNDLCRPMTYNINGQDFVSQRRSCVYSKNKDMGYSDTNIFLFEEAPVEILNLKCAIEAQFECNIDYVLVHIYETWDSKIGWHNDKEAMDSEIFSLSFGQTRRFIMKDRQTQTKIPFDLQDGDLFHMFGPRDKVKSCQHHFVHCVPPMTKKELLKSLADNNIVYNGANKKEEILKFMSKHAIQPIRINLTFRQF